MATASGFAEILREVDKYYSAKLRRYGPVPQGVDWNGAGSQRIRFDQLTKILDDVDPASEFNIVDFGCGYGALAAYLEPRFEHIRYVGYDISSEMIECATELHSGNARVRFTDDWDDVGESDFGVASGVFNVRGERVNEEWTQYVLQALTQLDAACRHGWSANLLTSYADADRMQPHLYYADPGFFFHWCKRNYSRHVSLLHDYPLWEFSILVRKDVDA